MKSMKKTIIIVMACSIIASMLNGCKKETPKTQNTDTKVNTKEKVEITLCLSQTGWGGECVDPELMDSVKKVIEEKTDTIIKMIAPPHNSYPDKLNVMLAGGDIPDVFTVTKAMENVPNFAIKGYAAPIDEYLKAPKYITKDQIKYFDNLKVQGKYYGIPRYTPMAKVIWTRKDIFDKYGVKLSSTPTTDEFYTEMKKLVGKGVVPFSFPKFMDNLPMFYNPFGGYPGLVQDKDGKYYDAFNTQETKDALTYLNKLYKEGILDKEFITNENTVMRDKLITGKAASNIDYYNRLIFYSPESSRNNTSTEFIPIYELKGPKGKGGNLNESIQDAYLISDKSKNKQRAFEVAEWIVYTEEGSRLTRLGVQDKHYTVKDGLFTPIEKASTSGYKATANSFFLSFVDVKNFGFKWDETTEKYLPQQLVINAEAQKHLGPKYVVPGGLSTLYDNIQPEYKKKIEEIAASIIMGNISLAEGYKQYESWWKSIDGDAMLKELNKK